MNVLHSSPTNNNDLTPQITEKLGSVSLRPATYGGNILFHVHMLTKKKKKMRASEEGRFHFIPAAYFNICRKQALNNITETETMSMRMRRKNFKRRDRNNVN